MPNSANDNEDPVHETAQSIQGACPLCGKPRDPHYRPFCSKHCADVDLARWLGGRYAIPARPSEEESGDSEEV